VSAATARKLLDAIGLSAGGDFLNLEDVSVLRGWIWRSMGSVCGSEMEC
jgi:hypothetical protein